MVLTFLPIRAYAQDDKMTTHVETAAEASRLAAERFNTLFSTLYFRNPIDGSYHPFPTLSASDFSISGEDASGWVIAYDPLVGPIVRGRVAKTGGYVQFDGIEFATE